MSFSVRRNSGDTRRLERFAPALLGLLDATAARNWERVIELADDIQSVARVEIILERLDGPNTQGEKNKQPKVKGNKNE